MKNREERIGEGLKVPQEPFNPNLKANFGFDCCEARGAGARTGWDVESTVWIMYAGNYGGTG